MVENLPCDRPENVKALDFPRGGVPPPGFVESCLMLLPVLGWIVASEIAKDRLRPVRRYLERQLAARPECVERFWGHDERRASLASFLRRSVSDSFGWPNDRFIPADSIEKVCFDDDGELFGIIEDAAERLGLPADSIGPDDMGEIGKMDIGTLVDWLLELADRCRTNQGLLEGEGRVG